jgi:hypothetical protein
MGNLTYEKRAETALGVCEQLQPPGTQRLGQEAEGQGWRLPL